MRNDLVAISRERNEECLSYDQGRMGTEKKNQDLDTWGSGS